jgi:hypothetical protein
MIAEARVARSVVLVVLVALVALVASALVLACTRGGDPPRDSRTRSASAAPVDSAAPGVDTADDCGLLETSLFPDPVALVRHHVALDNDARFLESTSAVDSVYACPMRLPGPDEFTVVGRSDVQPLTATDSMARVVVRSRKVGRMTQDSVGLVFVPEPGVVVDTFVVAHTRFGWRIESPQLPGRVLGSAVLARAERLPLRAEVRAKLVEAMSRSDAEGAPGSEP